MGDRLGQQMGNYRLVKLLGKGGFAEVYLGQHVRLSAKQAAIKILHLIDVDERKFQEEAETTEKLVHPHIVRLLDFDIEDGTPFLVLDYAPSGSLRTRHPKGSIVPLAQVGAYLKEIAPALQYAHDLHILHRDIKPDNMLIGRQGELLLSDFGIAVLTQTGRTSLPSAYGIGGTPYYMAPEMFRGKPEKASDQYSLAVVVYEWLCGMPPFTEGDPIQLGFQHAHEEVPPLRAKLPSLALNLEAVVMRALAKDPKDRFPSVQAFADTLEEASRPAPLQGSSPNVLQYVKPTIGTRLLTYRGHKDTVFGVAWSPDGMRVASYSADNTVQVWDASTGALLLTYTGHANYVTGAVWLSDGKRVASGSYDGTVQVWDASTGALLLTYTGHRDSVEAMAGSPVGTRVVSSAREGTVQVWDASSGRLLYTKKASRANSVAWSPDGTRIACSSEGTAQVWDASNGRLLYTYVGHTGVVFDVVWSPDGTRIASCSSDKTVQVWDASNGRLLYTYVGHTGGVHSVTWSPDGTRIASAASHPDKTVQVWDASNGQLLYTHTGHTRDVYAVAWSPDGKSIASAGDDEPHNFTVQVWQAGN